MNASEITNEKLLEAITQGNIDLKLIIDAVEVRLALKIEETNRKLVKENEELKNEIEIIERKNRRNNIVVFGIERINQELNILTTISEINKLLETDIDISDINDIYTLGRHQNAPIKIEFLSNLKKKQVFRNVRKLKGTNLRISHDLTWTQREDNKVLREHLMNAKETSDNVCFIKNNKLHVNGDSYDVSQLRQMRRNSPEPETSSIRSDPGTPIPTKINQPPMQKARAVRDHSTLTQQTAHPSANKPVSTTEKSVAGNRAQTTPKTHQGKVTEVRYRTRLNSGPKK